MRPAALLLAAGTSSRYRAAGGEEASKLLAPWRGEPLCRAAARAALASGASPVVVVTGHAREAVEAALAGLPLVFAHNPAFATGLASSLKAGVAALPPEAPAALVLLADMPEAPPTAIRALLDAFAARPDALAAAPLFSGRRGNPVLLSRALFPAIGQLEGDEGARRLLAQAGPGQVIEIAVDEAGVGLDIDTPEDLARASGGEAPE